MKQFIAGLLLAVLFSGIDSHAFIGMQGYIEAQRAQASSNALAVRLDALEKRVSLLEKKGAVNATTK